MFTKNFFWLKGLIFGVILSFVSALLFMLIGQLWAGGVSSFWGESWLYFSMVVPFAVTFAFLGEYFNKRKEMTNKKLWLVSLICAFLVTWYSGTIGAIFGEAIIRGDWETTNISGTLVWGTIYAFVLLPLTTPFARLLIEYFQKHVIR